MAAHHTTHRRMLAPPQPQPPPPHPSHPMDPTLKKHQSKQNPHHKITPPTQKQPPTKTIDTLLQAKSMTVSADFSAKSRHHLLHNHKPRLLVEKQEAAAADGSNKEKKKVKKSTKLVPSKVQEMVLEAEKKSRIKEDNNKGVIKELNQLMLEGFDIKKMSISLDGGGGGGGGGGRRRSFSGTQVELKDFLAGNGAKVVSVDMPSFMQIHAVDCARKTCDSLEKFASKSLALTLKKEFDGVYGPAWHCIVGTSFGSFVTHSVGGFMYFALDQKLYILLFKTTVQKAAD